MVTKCAPGLVVPLILLGTHLSGCGALAGTPCNESQSPGLEFSRPVANQQVFTGDVTLEVTLDGCPAMPGEMTWFLTRPEAEEEILGDCETAVNDVGSVLCKVRLIEGDHQARVVLDAADGASYESSVLFRAAGDPQDEGQD